MMMIMRIVMIRMMMIVMMMKMMNMMLIVEPSSGIHIKIFVNCVAFCNF